VAASIRASWRRASPRPSASCLAGAALSAALPFQIEAETAAGALVLLPIELPVISLNYGFIARRGRALSPAAGAFMDLVRAV